jgi:hypothetical protein
VNRLERPAGRQYVFPTEAEHYVEYRLGNCLVEDNCLIEGEPMLKKIGFVAAAMAAGAFVTGGIASAGTPDEEHGHHHGNYGYDHTSQVGLVNLDNTDVLHNVEATVGLCGNDINVLGVQVPIHDSLNGIGVPILSPGSHEASGENPYNCASGGLSDGGTSQGH